MVKKSIEQVSNKTILCSGTVLGNYENIKEYLFLMKKNILDYKYKKKLNTSLHFELTLKAEAVIKVTLILLCIIR